MITFSSGFYPKSSLTHLVSPFILIISVGYFNYRYFCNFLWFVELAMIYGAILSFEPFQNTSGPLYRQQLQNYRQTGHWTRLAPMMIPIPSERLPISLAFMLCLAVGLAVACLGGFHLYLCLTAQTTIEFHGNLTNRRKAHRLNKKWMNPYSLGWKRNFQQVFGTMPVWKAILIPSTREPEFLPLPIRGEDGKRFKYQSWTTMDDPQKPSTRSRTAQMV
jgi:palmitoyltransferase